MKIAIDASSVNDSGALTYLYELIINYQKNEKENLEIEIWANRNILNLIPNKEFLKKKDISKFTRNIFIRFIWHTFIFKKMLINHKTNILYSLSAFYLGGFKPFLLIHQNSLPFTKSEINNYKFSLKYLKLILQKKLTLYSFYRSIMVIFLTNYAKQTVISLLRKKINTKIIQHGLSKKFIRKPEDNYFLNKKYDKFNKIKLLYVSNFHIYKNHLSLLKAFNFLSKKYNLELNLIGKKSDVSFSKVNKFIIKNKIKNVNIIDNVNYDEILNFYKSTDISIYPSTCENFPFGVIESLGLSIPTLTSNYITNLDVTFNKIHSFDSKNIEDIIDKIETFILNDNLRKNNTIEAYNAVSKLDRKITSRKTIDVIKYSYENYIKKINE
jgi:glycosyltransferase involved in cell wall biosynthesis